MATEELPAALQTHFVRRLVFIAIHAHMAFGLCFVYSYSNILFIKANRGFFQASGIQQVVKFEMTFYNVELTFYNFQLRDRKSELVRRFHLFSRAVA